MEGSFIVVTITVRLNYVLLKPTSCTETIDEVEMAEHNICNPATLSFPM